MKIFFQCKNSGITGKHIEPVLLELKEKPFNVVGLISLIVEKIVEDYNIKLKYKAEDSTLHIPPYEEIEIQNLATTGKIAFGLLYNDKNVSVDQAVKTALSGYEDGLFKVFLNQELLGDLDSEISMTDGDLLTVVRLTFLSGKII